MTALERFAHVVIWGFFLLLPAFSLMASYAGLGVDDPEHPEGVSLRDERVHGDGLFFRSYRRTHAGGGILGGK